MGRKVKYDYAFKLRCVKQVLKNNQTVEDVYYLFTEFRTKTKQLILYLTFGIFYI